MEYKAEIKYEYEDFLAWNKVYAKTSNRKQSRIVGIVFIVLILITLGCTVYMAVIDALDATSILPIALVAIGSAVMLFRYRISARVSQKHYIKDMGTEYVSFCEDAIYVKNSKADSKNFYSGITDIYVDDDRFYFLLDKRHALILPKKQLSCGDFNEFAAFISEKTGLEIKYVKC